MSLYLPAGIWYDYHTLEQISSEGSNWEKSAEPDQDVPLFVRGGAIIPKKSAGANSTTERYYYYYYYYRNRLSASLLGNWAGSVQTD